VLSAAGKPDIVVGSPPEFKGEPDIWAPEELLVGSLNTCMMLTFLTLAQAQGLIPVGYESEAEGLLENVEEKYHITEVTVRPRVTLKSEAELEPARKIMESVEAHCFIANSMPFTGMRLINRDVLCVVANRSRSAILSRNAERLVSASNSATWR